MRILHGWMEIQNFSSISLIHCTYSWNIIKHKGRNFISLSSHVIFSLLYKFLRCIIMTFLVIFWRFLTILWRFSKICPNSRWTFPNIFQRFPKFSKDNPSQLKTLKIQRCFNHTPTNFSAMRRTKMLSKMISSHIWDIIFSDVLPLSIPRAPMFI